MLERAYSGRESCLRRNASQLRYVTGDDASDGGANAGTGSDSACFGAFECGTRCFDNRGGAVTRSGGLNEQRATTIARLDSNTKSDIAAIGRGVAPVSCLNWIRRHVLHVPGDEDMAERRQLVRDAVHEHRGVAQRAVAASRLSRRASNRVRLLAEDAIKRLSDDADHER